MGNLTNQENWAAHERLRMVELCLWWRGWVGRSDLIEWFRISMAQASSDLQKYIEINEEGILYQTKRKRYEATADFKPHLATPNLDEAVAVLLGANVSMAASRSDSSEASGGQWAILQMPMRRVDLDVARRVMMALLAGKKITVEYLSLSSGIKGPRILHPRAMAWDGHRWHLRAWCEQRAAWRDFVLGRILSASWPELAGQKLPEDEAWNTWEELKLQINPMLSAEKRESLKLDYGLDSEVLEMRVRQAFKRYWLAEMHLHEEGDPIVPHFVIPKASL